MYLTISSAKCYGSEQEKARLQGHGFKVWRDNGRYHASRQIATIEEVADAWGKSIFNIPNNDGYPEILAVRFDGVGCGSVAGGLWCQKGKVVMTCPEDPIHSDVFPFVLADVGKHAVSVTVDQPRLANTDGLPHFLRVLRICKEDFYKGVNPHFHTRKYIGRAKRRYLSWLKREGILPQNLERSWSEICAFMGRPGSQIGPLHNAKEDWEDVVEKEMNFSR